MKDSYLSNDQLLSAIISDSVSTNTSSTDKLSSTESTLHRKITVYSHKTNVESHEGGDQLPTSDENWVAYSNF